MGVITISRGSYSRGKKIAERLADTLGYDCVSRDILLETSEQFNIPEVKLIRAVHDAPSILDRLGHTKEKYITFIRVAFLERMQKDNVVYHGLAGHFFVRGIPNILKVRIIANMDHRVQEEMKREDISERDARRVLEQDDEERRKWGQQLYGIDTRDLSLYDIALRIDCLGVDDAVDVLTDFAKRPCFQTTPLMQRGLDDALLAAKAQKALLGRVPSAEVSCEAGVVYVNIGTILALEKEFTKRVNEILKDVEGIKEVSVKVIPFDT